jgi:hypothetical protein
MPAKSAVLLALVLVSAKAFGEELRQLRSVDISPEILEETPLLGPAQHTVYALAFSPDGRSLALALGYHHSDKGPVMHIVVLKTADYKRSFTVDVPISFVSKLAWSSDGAYLLVQSHQGSCKSCHIGDQSHDYLGFISPRVFVVAQNSLSRTTALSFFNTDCTRVGEAVTPFAINFGDADDKSGLIAASNPGEGVEILRAIPLDKLASVRDLRIGLRVVFFGAGRGFCAGAKAPDGDATMRCWLLGQGTPEPVSTFPARSASTLPVASARNSSLLAIENTALSYNRFTEGESAKFKGWTIWDPLLGQARGTVPARAQGLRFIPEQKHPRQTPYAAALSANGEVFAIAGNQALEIFSVP